MQVCNQSTYSRAGQIFDGWHPLFLGSVARVAAVTKCGREHFCMDQSVTSSLECESPTFHIFKTRIYR